MAKITVDVVFVGADVYRPCEWLVAILWNSEGFPTSSYHTFPTKPTRKQIKACIASSEALHYAEMDMYELESITLSEAFDASWEGV